MALIDQCGQVICAADVDADGEWNQPLRQLRDYAREPGQAGGGLPLIGFDRLRPASAAKTASDVCDCCGRLWTAADCPLLVHDCLRLPLNVFECL